MVTSVLSPGHLLISDSNSSLRSLEATEHLHDCFSLDVRCLVAHVAVAQHLKPALSECRPVSLSTPGGLTHLTEYLQSEKVNTEQVKVTWSETVCSVTAGEREERRTVKQGQRLTVSN